jgi:hypothetical protein
VLLPVRLRTTSTGLRRPSWSGGVETARGHRSLNARANSFARPSTWLLDHRHQADNFPVGPVSTLLRHPSSGFPGQAVTGGSLVSRRRRLRGAPAAPVVDPGLRPRFFSVLPTPANFRSR